MIIEDEILEQIAYSGSDWPFARVFKFIAQHKDPWPVLQALYREKYIALYHASGEPLEQWKADEIFRNRIDAVIGVLVKVMPAGAAKEWS